MWIFETDILQGTAVHQFAGISVAVYPNRIIASY